MVCFNFVNTYSSIVYVAFFKGKFSGSAANPRHLFGLAVEVGFTITINFIIIMVIGVTVAVAIVVVGSYPVAAVVVVGSLGCSPAGCMSELMIQLLIIMGGKQAWGGLLEILI
eukprot:Awhi_evm1s9567